MNDELTNYVAGQNRITCEVTDRAYTPQGEGPITTCMSLETARRLNGAGQFTATFPDNDPATAHLVPKSRLVRFYVDGVHQMTGIVERTSLALDNNGERTLTVSGRDMAGELAETPLVDFSVGSPTPTTNIVQGLFVYMTAHDAGVIWTGHDLAGDGDVQTDNAVVASFSGESVLGALTTVAEHIGESFRVWRDGSRKLTWLGSATPSSGVRAIGATGDQAHFYDNADVTYIQQFEVETDGYELLTQVHPYGAGQGHARLNILNHTRTDPPGYVTHLTAIRSEAAEAAVGKKIGRALDFKDIRPLSSTSADLISAKNQLYDAGLAYLKRAESAGVVTSYRLSVSHVPEALDVGTTIRVVYADDVYEIDADFVVLEIRSRYGAGANEAHELVVAPLVRKPVGDVDFVVDRLTEAKIFAAHPQLNANSYTTGYRLYVGDDQTTGRAALRFWFGEEVVQLERVLLRLTVQPVAAFSATVGGDAAVEVDDISVTVTGTVDIPHHQHQITVAGSSGGENLTLNTAGGSGFLTKASGGDVLINTNPDSGGVSDVALSGSGTGSGTVDLASALSTSYGVFRAAQIDTYAYSDLEYSLNGGPWISLSTADILGGGWYQLDLSSSLYDANFRPINAQNIVEFRRSAAAGTGKSAMIDAQLAVRSIIMGNALT